MATNIMVLRGDIIDTLAGKIFFSPKEPTEKDET